MQTDHDLAQKVVDLAHDRDMQAFAAHDAEQKVKELSTENNALRRTIEERNKQRKWYNDCIDSLRQEVEMVRKDLKETQANHWHNV